MKRCFLLFIGLLTALNIAMTNAGELKFRISTDILAQPKTILEGNVGKTIFYEFDNGLFLGGTIYSAALGNAGGLFIGGYEIGQKYYFNQNNFVEAALFYGGGGGAGVVGGDGMLLRPRVMIGQKVGDFEISAGAAYMHVTGSKISSPAFEFSISRAINPLSAAGHVGVCGHCVRVSRSPYVSVQSVGASFKSYIPALGTKKRSGLPLEQFYLAGAGININMDHMWGKGWESFITASGAMGGDGEGYAEVLVGGRYGYDFDWTNIYADLAVGLAGGGDVDTGGGVIVAANIGANWRIFGSAELEASIGYVAGISGGFQALVPSIKLSAPLGFAGGTAGSDGDYKPTHWSVSTGYSIIPEHKNMRYAHDKDTGFLGLTDFRGDLLIGNGFYMTGHALSVTTGGAGGFAIGLVGIGATLPIAEKIDLSGELLIGAAAGGAINVRGGLVTSAQLDLDYKLNETVSLTSNLGWIKAVKGGLNGVTVGVGVKLHFTSFR